MKKKTIANAIKHLENYSREQKAALKVLEKGDFSNLLFNSFLKRRKHELTEVDNTIFQLKTFKG